MKIFVSSTSLDLKEHRAAVIAKLRRGGLDVLCMEDYAAQPEIPVVKSLHDVASCDMYVGILAWRYGYVPEGYGDRSITELEYRKAEEMHIPTLVFLLDESAEWPDRYRDSGEEAERIRALRTEIRNKQIVGFFKRPEDLVSEVLSAITNYMLGRWTTPTAKQRRHVVGIVEGYKNSLSGQEESTREPIPVALPRLRGLFVDRETERECLRNWLHRDDKNILLIVAPGGFGKTELMTKVLKEIAPSTTIVTDSVQGILYLRCVRGDLTLAHIFDDAGRMAGQQEEFLEAYRNGEWPLKRKLEFFFRELSRLGNVWIVMDNFEDLLTEDDKIADPELERLFEFYVELEHTVRLIVTSRAIPRFKGDRRLEKLDLSAGLPEDKAVEYLREEGAPYGLAETDERLIRAFVQRVHRIPKALESVLGYLADHYPQISLAQLMEDTELFADFDRHDLESGLKKLVAEQFARLSLNAKLALCVLSIFPQPVPQAALRFVLPAIPILDFATILSRLERNRLLIHHGDTYDLHPVVREYVYGTIPPDEDCPPLVGGAVGSVGEFTQGKLHARAVGFYRQLRQERSNRKSIGYYEPHLQEIFHLIRAREHDTALGVLNAIETEYLRVWGSYQRVIELREQLIERLAKPDQAKLNWNRLGCCYDMTGRVRQAMRCHQEELRIARETSDTRGQADALANLGHLSCEVGELRQAVDYCTEARERDRECLNLLGEGIDRPLH